MTNVVSINFERTGFPVKIGGVECFFSVDEQNLMSFYDTEKREVLTAKLNDLEKNRPNEDSTKEEVELWMEDLKAALRELYDQQLGLGAGAFDKLYEKYADPFAFIKMIIPISEAIAKGIDSYSQDQTKELLLAKKEKMKK